MRPQLLIEEICLLGRNAVLSLEYLVSGLLGASAGDDTAVCCDRSIVRRAQTEAPAECQSSVIAACLLGLGGRSLQQQQLAVGLRTEDSPLRLPFCMPLASLFRTED